MHIYWIQLKYFYQNAYNSHIVSGKKGEQGNPGIPGMICLSVSLKYDSPHVWVEWEYTLCRMRVHFMENESTLYLYML